MSDARTATAGRKTATDITLTFSRQFLAAFLQLGILLIVARALGPEGAGAYSVSLLLPTVMSQLFNLGLPSANVYFIASGKYQLSEVWVASRDVVMVTGVLGLGLGGGVIAFLGERAFPGIAAATLLWALMIFPVSLMTGIVAGLFQALQDFRAFNVTVLIQPMIALIAVGIVAAFGGLSVEAVLISAVGAHAVALTVALILLARRTPVLATGAARMAYLRPAITYGVKAHLGNIISFLNYRLDLFLVNLLIGPSAAGIYTVAVRLTEQLWMISQAVSTVIFPRMSAMAGNEAERRAFTPAVARIVFWITLLASALLAAIARPLISLLFGDGFEGAATVLIVLLPGIVLLAMARVLANDFAARGWVGINLAMAGGILVINTAANLILIPPFGIVGAALATTLAYSTITVLRLFLQTRLTGISWKDCVLPTRNDIDTVRALIARKHA